MAEEPRLNKDLESFAAALSGLTPRPVQLNRDQLMYAAGRAAALSVGTTRQASLRFWKTTTAVSTATAGCLLAILLPAFVAPPGGAPLRQPVSGRTIIDTTAPRMPGVPAAPQLDKSPALSNSNREMSYLARRNLVLASELDKLPSVRITEDDPVITSTYREVRESLMNSPDFGG